MRSFLACSALLALATCTDLVDPGFGPEYSVWVTPSDHATNVGATAILVQVASSYSYNSESEIPPDLLQTLAHESVLLDASGKAVPVTVESGFYSQSVDGGEAWCRSEHGETRACVRLTPNEPLADGWYDLGTGPGVKTYHLSNGSKLQSHFHVGSLPQITKVEVYEKGGLNGAIWFSEPISAQGLREAICPHAVRAPNECWTVEMQGDSNESAWFTQASGTVQDEIAISVNPGVKATTGAPLRDGQGNETFVISLGPITTDSPPTRVWGL